jgi:hypothetical protein
LHTGNTGHFSFLNKIVTLDKLIYMSNAEMRKKVKKYIDEADDHVVKMVYSMLEADREDGWWDDLPVTVQKGIVRAEKQLKDGKGIPHEIVMKKYSKWLTK